MVSNLYGKKCKVYTVPASVEVRDEPSGSDIINLVIPNSVPAFDFNYAIPVVQNSSASPGGSFFLFDKPTLPTLPSAFNAETAAKLDAWIPNWQLTSVFYAISDGYEGAVNTQEPLALFANKMDITSYVADSSCRALLMLFDDKFAIYFPCPGSNDWIKSSSLYDLVSGNRDPGGSPMAFIQFRNGKSCATSLVVKEQQSASNNRMYRYNTASSANANMSDSVFYGNGGSFSMDTDFIRYLEKDFVPPVPTDEDDPYGPGGTSGPGGGTGTFDGSSDPIDIPGLPTLSAVDTGFITLFNPTLGQLKNLANYMWSDTFSLDNFKKIFANPMDAILGLSIVPVAVPSAGGRQVTVGNIPTGVQMNVATTQYVSVDCGTLNVEEFWGAYLDYDPYTKCSIFLPYIGVHPIKTDDVMGKSVHVVYHVDILSGSCVAFVKCGDSVLYEFIGQLASSIPVTGDNFTNVINGVLNIAGSIGTMVATGGFSVPAGMAKKGLSTAYQLGNEAGMLSSMAQDVMAMKPEIEKSGSLSGTGGMLGNQKPYMILERPRQALPVGFNGYAGYPSHMTAQLGSLSGYTEVEHIHLENIPCTMKEADEIMAFLENGVIL